MNKETILYIGGGAVLLVLWLTRKPIVSTVSKIKSIVMDNVLKFIIQYNEGGYVSPEQAKKIGDTGGETKYGISKKQYPKLDIKNLTLDNAVEIYKKDYVPSILKYVSSETPDMVYQILDMAINAGPSRALKLYKPGMSVESYKKARLNFYAGLAGWKVPVVQKSWINRTNRNFIG